MSHSTESAGSAPKSGSVWAWRLRGTGALLTSGLLVAAALVCAPTTTMATDAQVVAGWTALAEKARDAIAARLGRPLTATIEVEVLDEPAPVDPGSWDFWAFADPFDAAGAHEGPMERCSITVNVDAGQLDSTEQYALMVHEVFHCFSFDLGVIPAHAGTPDWVFEGAAEWVTLTIVPASSTALANFDDWLTKPTRPLWYRSYDGLGVFELLDDVGVDPWSMMDEIFLTAADGPDIGSRTQSALGLMSTRAGDAFLDTWGARHHHRSSIGAAWDFHPTADISGLTVNPTTFPVAEGDERSVHVGRFAAFPFTFQPLAEVVEVRAIVGGGWVNFDGADSPLSDLVNSPICTLPEGCACTPESPQADATFTPVTLGSDVAVGISGGFDDGFTALTGWKLADWCDQADELDPCLVGTWVSDGFLVPHVLAITGGEGIIFTIQADGTSSTDFDLMEWVDAIPETGEGLVSMRWYDSGFAEIRASKGRFEFDALDLEGVRFSMYVQLGDTTVEVYKGVDLGSLTAQVPDAFRGMWTTAEGGYDCSNTSLALMPDAGSDSGEIVTFWTRQEEPPR